MSEADVSPLFAQELRDKLAGGDLAWLRENFQAGRLNFLRPRLSSDEHSQFFNRLKNGDLPWMRDALSRIEVAGVGPLSPPVTSPGPWQPPAGSPEAHIPVAPLSPADLTESTKVAPVVTESAALQHAMGTGPVVAAVPSVAAAAVSSDVHVGHNHTEATTTTTVTKKRRRWFWPLVLLALLAALLWWLSNRNDDKTTVKKPVATTSTASASTIAGGATTVAAGATTAPAGATTVAGGATTAPAGATTVAGGATTASAKATTAAPAATAALLDSLAADKNHATLIKAIQAAGLTDTLKSGGPYTIFAPTDAAFGQLPPGVLDKLLADKDALTKVLLYHVAQGNLVPGSLKAGPLPSLQGSPLTIKLEGANVMVNGVAATPGASSAYSIGKLLVPPDFSIDSLAAPPTTAAGAATTVAGATTVVPATTAKPATTAATAAPTTAAPVATAAPAGDASKLSVYYNVASSDLTAAARTALDALAAKIKASGPKTVVKVSGFADERSSSIGNEELSRERAQRVVDYLSGKLGVVADYKPVVIGGAVAGTDYEKARRADIEIG